jgi:hypothetical protein
MFWRGRLEIFAKYKVIALGSSSASRCDLIGVHKWEEIQGKGLFS